MFTLEKPQPDFEAFREVLMGEEKPRRTHFVEYAIDFDMMNTIAERLKIDMKPFPDMLHYIPEELNIPQQPLDVYEMARSTIKFFHQMGYDYVQNFICSPGVALLIHLSLFGKRRLADDTAPYATPGVKRVWVEENKGLVSSWEEFEELKSQEILQLPIKEVYEFISENLPEGMKVASAGGSLWEVALERVMGYVNLFRKLHEDPDLVKAVLDWIGERLYKEYKEVVKFDCVGVIFHADDLGYKKGTMVNPDVYREMVFPWFKRYAALAHQHGKMYWYHACGNVSAVIEDFIEDVKIDAFHSFQDEIMPVWEFQEKYGDRVAVLGGVDVDKLVRYDVDAIRTHVRSILDKCMPRGRYALGSGNSVTNYVPPENYLAMLDEGRKWKP
ncbi:MAG: uroporphyrinogen decarboxylase family protein [Candidatus Freyarchaeota archaeon]